MSDQEIFALAYNAHEWAERSASEAIIESLRLAPAEALMCLADPQWRWETRSGGVSAVIVDLASEVLDEKLEALVST